MWGKTVKDIEKTCFVIQRFDGGKFDKRYIEIFKKAIEDSSLKPVRADEVLGTRPIIETIESQITSCDAVLAEISENNENVFLELGYALAKNKPCVIICDKEVRNDLPFDIRHRPIIFYDSHSPSSFKRLTRLITSHLKEEIGRDKQVRMANVQKKSGELSMEDYENAVLGIILSKTHTYPEGVSIYWISQDFEKLNYNETTLSLALTSLKEKGLILQDELYDEETRENYQAFRLSDDGLRYVLDNRDIFVAKKEPVYAPPPIPDDDIPF